MSARIRVDYTEETGAAISCRDCPHWHAWRWTRVEAWEAAREHERRSHPGARQATTNLAYWRHKTPAIR